ncbi:acyltransferase family protein [Clostridium sp. 19966]|uniref:acyltransferase family protein n=1 Tax=Clostridium sp. 19966 TaxID=2768166 RepID=UPI0028E025A5|nr:acyltransferase family protein [Clostridium sp. 19966]MDT8717691.1 acyltransferase family protein [Clostridium sp. 19966]
MRKYYIDNIRTLAILLLFPFHTCRIFNSFETFYVVGKPNAICDNFIRLTSEWFMPLLFTIAGISTALALNKRSTRQFIRERFFKLFVPFIFGLILIVPIQTFFAEKQHNGYTGSYFQQYILFFTKITDLSGYTGGFTPAHLWFLLFLFLISLVSLPVIAFYKKSDKRIKANKFNLLLLIILFVFNFALSPLEIGGQSFGKYLSFFLLGYLILSMDYIMELLEKNTLILLIITIIFSALRMVMIYKVDSEGISAAIYILLSAFNSLTTWIIVLTILALGKRYLNFRKNIFSYLSRVSFPIYVFHQTWLVVIGYYALSHFDSSIVQFNFIMFLTFAVSLLTCEVLKRTAITRFMFGIKK